MATLCGNRMRPGCRTRSVADNPYTNGIAATDAYSNAKADADVDADSHGNSHRSQYY